MKTALKLSLLLLATTLFGTSLYAYEGEEMRMELQEQIEIQHTE